MIKLIPLLILGALVLHTPKEHKRLDKPGVDTIVYFMKVGDYMTYEKNEADFFRVVVKADSGKANVADFYLDGKKRNEGLSLTRGMNFTPVYQGVVTSYYKNGNKQAERKYNNGKLAGDAIEYYSNGNIHTIIRYDSTAYLKEYRDSTGAVLAQNGNGHWVQEPDGFHEPMQGEIVNGKKEGVWTKTNLVGKQTEVKFINGKVPMEPFKLQDNMVSPMFRGGEKGFSKYLSKTIKYTAVARDYDIQGRSILTFVVEKDGSLSSIQIVSRAGGGLDEEAVRVLKISPPWLPGTEDGKPVRVQYSIPVNFGLGR
jgi:TonB family protein